MMPAAILTSAIFTSQLLSYAAIAVMLLCAEVAYIALARRWRIVDTPGERGSQSETVIRGGGIIFIIGVWLYELFFGPLYLWAAAGFTLVAAVSFIDDLGHLSVDTRLMAQFAAVAMMFIDMDLYGGDDWWVALPLSVACVGVINAFNFMDGINGMTALYTLVLLGALAFINISVGFVAMPFIAVTAIAAAVFGAFNARRRAVCFAGDVGAITVGAIAAFMALRLILVTGQPAYMLLLAVYGADAGLTIVHRAMLRERLGEAHRMHAYEIMANELRLPQMAVATGYCAVQAAISAGLILFIARPWGYFAAVCVVLIVAYILFMKRYFKLHRPSNDDELSKRGISGR